MVSLLFLCILFLFIFYPTQQQTISFTKVFDDICIPSEDYAFFCTTLLRLENIQDANANTITTYLGLNHTYNEYNYNFIYRHIQNIAVDSNIETQLTCFIYPMNDDTYGGNIQYTLYNNSAHVMVSEALASITLNNIADIMDINKPSETIYATFTDNIASINYPIVPIAEISAYISNIQCIEIISLTTTNDTRDDWFFIEGKMWRSTDITQLTTSNAQLFTTSQSNAYNDDIEIIFNSMYCFEEKAVNNNNNNNNELLAFVFTVRDYSDDNKQYLTIREDDNDSDLDLVIDNWWNMSGVEYYTINFNMSDEVASLQIGLWQSCNITSISNIDVKGDEDRRAVSIMHGINDKISMFTTIFLMTICFFGILTIFTVLYFSKKRYSRSDPINYFAVIWMVLELWDFFSDLAYVIYLYYFTVYYPNRFEFYIMFIIGALFLIIPYTMNLCYYSFLNQLWQQDAAPTVSSKWLKRYSWILLFICLVTGGVHPALEFTNSLLFPRILFSMHLPYSELIRVRSERFVTNVLFENFPFLILQITFYFIIENIESGFLKSLNGGINIVFWGTVFSSILSVLFSGTYYFSYKYRIQSAIAIYSFSFGFRSDEFKHYWLHSHWRFQTAISKALLIGTPSLIIVDNVVDTKKKNKKKFIHETDTVSLYIYGRIVHDPSCVKSKLKLMQYDLKHNEQREEMTEIATTLLHLLRNEFNLRRSTDQVKIINFRIKNINGGQGENIFELHYEDTLKNICCWRCNVNKKQRIKDIDSNLKTQMQISDVGIINDNDGDDGIYVAHHNDNEYKEYKASDYDYDYDYDEKEPTYLKKTTLPMVSINAMDGSNVNNLNMQRIIKHQPKFSTLSTIIKDDPYAIDELRQTYHD